MVKIMSQMCVIDGESLHNMTPLDSFSKCKQLSVLDVTQLQDFEKICIVLCHELYNCLSP